MRAKLCFVAAAIAASVLLASDAQAGPFGRRANVDLQAAEAEARIMNLPDDSAMGYVTIIVHSDWLARPDEVALVEKWQAMPEVAGLAGKAHFLSYTEKDPLYQQRLAANNPLLPAIIVQDHEGYVLFKDHGWVPPGKRAIFPWNNRPAPCPGPGPCPGPKPDVNVVVQPPVPDRLALKETAQAADDPSPWLLVALLIVVAIGVCVATFAVQFHRRVNQIKS